MEYDQVGVLPFRRRDGDVEVLLITTRKRGRWICPKGNIEKNLGLHASAHMEAFEEAGVEGRILPPALGIYAHGDPPETDVRIFLLEVEEEHGTWPEADERERQWLPLEEAAATVDEDGLRLLLVEAYARFSAGTVMP